jgi:hypothetical protein
LISPLIDATGLTAINVSFKWRCAGELNFDEGSIGYISESDPTTVYLFTPVLNNKPGAATTSSFNLPAELNNTKFYFVFYWYNDESAGEDPGLTIDDVVMTGQAVSIESTLNTAVTAPQFAGQTVQYISADNQIITRIAGLSENVGCITATLQNAGTGRTAIQTSSGSFFRTDKVIRISPAVANTTAAYQATFYFTAAELSPTWSPPEIAALKILKVRDGVNLSSVITSADAKLVTPVFVNNTATGGYYAFTGNFSGGFSQFMLVSPAFTLPVSLLTFEAHPAKTGIVLSWKTASEKVNKGFYIERSTNGADFSSIGWVNGSGNTGSASTYNYTDNFVQPNTLYYYRLQQVDVDSRSTLSDTRQAKIASNSITLSVSPNPAKNRIQVFVAGSTRPANVTLVNAKGQAVAKWMKAMLNVPYAIDISRFSKGYYNLVVELPGGDVTKQILIQ